MQSEVICGFLSLDYGGGKYHIMGIIHKLVGMWCNIDKMKNCLGKLLNLNPNIRSLIF